MPWWRSSPPVNPLTAALRHPWVRAAHRHSGFGQLDCLAVMATRKPTVWGFASEGDAHDLRLEARPMDAMLNGSEPFRLCVHKPRCAWAGTLELWFSRAATSAVTWHALSSLLVLGLVRCS